MVQKRNYGCLRCLPPPGAPRSLTEAPLTPGGQRPAGRSTLRWWEKGACACVCKCPFPVFGGHFHLCCCPESFSSTPPSFSHPSGGGRRAPCVCTIHIPRVHLHLHSRWPRPLVSLPPDLFIKPPLVQMETPRSQMELRGLSS